MSLRRLVALKILPFTASHDAKQLGRFRNEAQAAAQVQHPNIVPVYAVGEENGVHYYAMQLIPGRCLAKALIELRSVAKVTAGTTVANLGSTENEGARKRSTIQATGDCGSSSIADERGRDRGTYPRYRAAWEGRPPKHFMPHTSMASCIAT